MPSARRMLHRLPAGNRVVGNHERDDPGRVLGRGALVGARGLVDLGALDGPADRVVAEPAGAHPVFVHLREHGAHHPDERLSAWEDLHDAAAARELAVGALLHVVGAQPDVVLVGEIQMGRGVGLGLFQHLGRLGAEALNPGGGESVELPHELGVALGEHGLQDAQHGVLFLPGWRVAGGSAHRVRDAALPRGARVGADDVWQVALLQVGDRLVQRRAHPRHLAGAHVVCAHALCHALHLPGGHAVGHHLGHSGDDRAFHTREPLDEVLGEVAAARSFGTLRSMVPMLVTSLRSR